MPDTKKTSTRIINGFLNAETKQPIKDIDTDEYITEGDSRIFQENRKWYYKADDQSERIQILKYKSQKSKESKESRVGGKGQRSLKQYAFVDSDNQFIYVKDRENNDTKDYVLINDECIAPGNKRGEYIYTDPNGNQTVVMRYECKMRENTIGMQSFYSLVTHEIMVDADGNNLSWDECRQAKTIIEGPRRTYYYQPQKDKDLTPIVRYKTFHENYKDNPKQKTINNHELSLLRGTKKTGQTKVNGFVYPDTQELVKENDIIVTRENNNIKKATNSIYKYKYINPKGEEFAVSPYKSWLNTQKRKNEGSSNSGEMQSRKRNKPEAPSVEISTMENQVTEPVTTSPLIGNSIFTPPHASLIQQQAMVEEENIDDVVDMLLELKK